MIDKDQLRREGWTETPTALGVMWTPPAKPTPSPAGEVGSLIARMRERGKNALAFNEEIMGPPDSLFAQSASDWNAAADALEALSSPSPPLAEEEPYEATLEASPPSERVDVARFLNSPSPLAAVELETTALERASLETMATLIERDYNDHTFTDPISTSQMLRLLRDFDRLLSALRTRDDVIEECAMLAEASGKTKIGDNALIVFAERLRSLKSNPGAPRG